MRAASARCRAFPQIIPQEARTLFLAEEAEPPHFVEQSGALNTEPSRRAGRPPEDPIRFLQNLPDVLPLRLDQGATHLTRGAVPDRLGWTENRGSKNRVV